MEIKRDLYLNKSIKRKCNGLYAYTTNLDLYLLENVAYISLYNIKPNKFRYGFVYGSRH